MFAKETGWYLVPVPHKPFCVQLKEKKTNLIPTLEVLLSSAVCIVEECFCLSSGNSQGKWDRKNK